MTDNVKMPSHTIKYIDPNSEYLQNAWYVALHSDKLSREALLPLTLLGENLVFFRNDAGVPFALENACPHRKLPLSMGTLTNGAVQCGYHGLTFDGQGQCVYAPTQDMIPVNAIVRSYPLIEKYGFIWIWMGDPDQAHESKILEVEDYDHPDWGLTDGGVLDCNCHYLYLLDNLLDPSHVAWVHKTSFASDGTEDVPLEIEEKETGVLVSRWIKNIDPPPYYAEMLPFSGKVDRLQYYEAVIPSVAINMSTYARVGYGGADNDLPDDTYRMRSYHFITPVDAHSTRYHWFQHYNTHTKDEEVRQKLNEGARNAFEEDRVILEAVDKGMNEKKRANLDLRLDLGARRFRKKLEALVRAEKSSA